MPNKRHLLVQTTKAAESPTKSFQDQDAQYPKQLKATKPTPQKATSVPKQKPNAQKQDQYPDQQKQNFNTAPKTSPKSSISVPETKKSDFAAALPQNQNQAQLKPSSKSQKSVPEAKKTTIASKSQKSDPYTKKSDFAAALPQSQNQAQLKPPSKSLKSAAEAQKTAPAAAGLSLKSGQASKRQSSSQHPLLRTGTTTASPNQQQNTKILGIQKGVLIEIGIIIAVVIIVIYIIVKLYRRYKTKKDYNESPENFPHKPSLAMAEQYHLNDCKVQACLSPQSITIQEKNEMAGKIWKVQFRGTQKSAIYFHRRQNTTTYYQIELLSVHGSVQMGFVPVNSFDKIKSGEESIGNSGVGVTNAGYVQAEGENLYNYGWTLIYGDVFGMGLTRQNSKFSQRRAWISKNGVLLNTPPSEELGRWLATIDISAQQKAEYNLGTQQKQDQEQQVAEGQQDQEKIKAKAQRQKIEGLLKKQRISLKTFNAFEYYPVIYFYGNKTESKTTVININVGGQVFRMFDSQFRSGLLKDKAIFGDD